jgi:phosphopentomutase
VSRNAAGVGHAEMCAAAGDAEADSFSHVSSIEVELPVPSQDVLGEDQPVEGRVSNIVASAAHTMRGMHGGR